MQTLWKSAESLLEDHRGLDVFRQDIPEHKLGAVKK